MAKTVLAAVVHGFVVTLFLLCCCLVVVSFVQLFTAPSPEIDSVDYLWVSIWTTAEPELRKEVQQYLADDGRISEHEYRQLRKRHKQYEHDRRRLELLRQVSPLTAEDPSASWHQFRDSSQEVVRFMANGLFSVDHRESFRDDPQRSLMAGRGVMPLSAEVHFDSQPLAVITPDGQIQLLADEARLLQAKQQGGREIFVYATLLLEIAQLRARQAGTC